MTATTSTAAAKKAKKKAGTATATTTMSDAEITAIRSTITLRLRYASFINRFGLLCYFAAMVVFLTYVDPALIKNLATNEPVAASMYLVESLLSVPTLLALGTFCRFFAPDSLDEKKINVAQSGFRVWPEWRFYFRLVLLLALVMLIFFQIIHYVFASVVTGSSSSGSSLTLYELAIAVIVFLVA